MASYTPNHPWRTVSVVQGNAIQISGLFGASILAWYAARLGRRGTIWLITSRVLAYFCEHALAHWVVGRLVGIRFVSYGVSGTAHSDLYPPGMNWIFSHLPLLSAHTDPASRHAASPLARAALYLAGPLTTVLVSLIIPIYGERHDIPHARRFLIGLSAWSVMMLYGEAHPHGDLYRAWRALRQREHQIDR